MTPLIRLAPTLVLLLVFVVGCDTVTQQEAKPPTLIPAQAFTVQAELFDDQEQSDETGIDTHAMIAQLRVWPVTTALAEHLTLPAAVTEAALEQEPATEDDAWVWTATTATEEGEVEFVLSGTFRDDHVDWSMHVTETTSDRDSTFLLYTAKTAPDGSAGSWRLYAPDDDTTQHVLGAEFEVEKKEEKEIVFQVPETASEHAGDEVVYVQEGDERSFQWVQVGDQREHTIVWDAETHAGSIAATNYNDGEKACWDEALQNEECSD